MATKVILSVLAFSYLPGYIHFRYQASLQNEAIRMYTNTYR